MTMRAAVIESSRRLAVVDASRPDPAPGRIRVRLEGCGVCASNLPLWEGRPWFHYPLPAGQPGHEGWGVVEAAGRDVTSVREGDRVAFLSNHAYAECDIADADAAVKLPDALHGRPFPGEALGCAMNIFRRSGIEAGQTVAVIGAGFLGNLLIQLAAGAGARVIAISRRAAVLELAKRCGAHETIAMDDRVRLANVRAGRVIECVGLQGTLDLAGDLIAERGRLVIAGYHQDGTRRVDLQKWNWLGIDVVNAHERDPRSYVRGIREAIDATIDGRIAPELLLTHAYSLEDLGSALDDVARRPDGFVKGFISLLPRAGRKPDEGAASR
jgi:threonine dehydrogenase-like Zn-dependent dehydrogenase